MLELKNIFTRYGKVECLKCVDLIVKEGEIVALLGANGAGKSTTLKTISGLVRPTAGEVMFRGKKIHTLTTEAVMRLGISQVPEGRKIFHRLTVLENLELGAFIRGGDQSVSGDIDRMFATFPILRTRAGQKAGTLSGGEQQMLAIARALMSRPDVLLLDEPSLGLAPLVVSAIFKIIQDINRQGRTILLVEQNARMALGIASRAYVMETGRVVLSGAARDVEKSPEVQEAYLGGKGA